MMTREAANCKRSNSVKALTIRRVLIACFLWSAGAGSVLAECGESDLRNPSVHYRVVAQNFVYPWNVAFLPAGDILVTERPGRLRVIRQGLLLDEPIHGLPRLVNLFDVAVHPDFVNNSLLYLAYFARDAGAIGLDVLRARLVENRLVDKEVIFRATPKTSPSPLSGGRLLFLGSELMITVGDKPDGLSNGQDTTNHFGTVVKITDSGLSPKDSADKDTRLPEIYSFGHRNIQGIALDQKTGEVWIAEHGPTGGDELNILHPGGNYGWPTIHSPIGQDLPIKSEPAMQESFESPVYTWTTAIAPSGLAIYRGNRLPSWNGSMFVGSLLDCHVLRFRFGANGQLVAEETLLDEFGDRIRDVRVGPDEMVYILTDEMDGKLISIAPYD